MAGDDETIGIIETGNEENNQDEINPDNGTGNENSTGEELIDESSEGTANSDDKWNPSIYVDKNNDKLFQARVFHEKNKQVYGAEIVLFDNDKEIIDTILITDKADFDAYAGLVDNMTNVYAPFTKQDEDNLTILKKLASKQIDETSVEYKNMQWSVLSDVKYLDEILANSNQNININAKYLSGFQSGDFAKLDHEHRGYLKDTHASEKATTNNMGHVHIVDNLNKTTLMDGEVLSAKQGNVLKKNIDEINSKITNPWSKVIKKGDYITYEVLPLLRLVVCNYSRDKYKGLSSETGAHQLHKADTINKKYQPTQRIITPLYRGDVTLYYNRDGSIGIYNLTKHKEINIKAQVMWHY